MNLLPAARPKASYFEVLNYLQRSPSFRWQKEFNFDLETGTIRHETLFPTSPVFLVGVRGYYEQSMGSPLGNDRGLYDDAIFIMSRADFRAFNANTDPSRVRKGYGFGAKKGMAVLQPGVWQYKIGLHKGLYRALRQAGPVMVKRDGEPAYLDRGWFGINIHKGGRNTTSSLGCQTLPPAQWEEFITTVSALTDRHHQKIIPYILIEC